MFSEPWRDHDYFDEDVVHAQDALAQVIQRRVFAVERRAEFDFLTYGSSVAELRDFMVKESAHKEGPEDEAEETAKAELYFRVEKSWHAAGNGAEVARRERARIARLRPLREG